MGDYENETSTSNTWILLYLIKTWKKQGERVRVIVYNKTLKVMLLPMENSRGKEWWKCLQKFSVIYHQENRTSL